MERLLLLPEIQEVNNCSVLPAVLGKQITVEYEEMLKKKALKVQSDSSYHFCFGNCIMFTQTEAHKKYVAEIHIINPFASGYSIFNINRMTTFIEAERILKQHMFALVYRRGEKSIFKRGKVVLVVSRDLEHGKVTKTIISCG